MRFPEVCFSLAAEHRKKNRNLLDYQYVDNRIDIVSHEIDYTLTKPNTILNVFKYYFEKLFLIYFMKYI